VLILTRKNKESVIVGNPDGSGSTLKVTVLRCRDGAVRLGFESPRQVAIHRMEVWDRIHADSRPDRFSDPPRRNEISADG